MPPPPPSRPGPGRGRRDGPPPDATRTFRRSLSGSTPWMRWNSVLHCTAPVRTSHSQLPTWASASPSSSRRSASARAAWASRCSVVSRTTTTRRPPPTGDIDMETGVGSPSGRSSSVSNCRTSSPASARAVTAVTSACKCSGKKTARCWSITPPAGCPKRRSQAALQVMMRPRPSAAKMASALVSRTARRHGVRRQVAGHPALTLFRGVAGSSHNVSIPHSWNGRPRDSTMDVGICRVLTRVLGAHPPRPRRCGPPFRCDRSRAGCGRSRAGRAGIEQQLHQRPAAQRSACQATLTLGSP